MICRRSAWTDNSKFRNWKINTPSHIRGDVNGDQIVYFFWELSVSPFGPQLLPWSVEALQRSGGDGRHWRLVKEDGNSSDDDKFVFHNANILRPCWQMFHWDYYAVANLSMKITRLYLKRDKLWGRDGISNCRRQRIKVHCHNRASETRWTSWLK